MNVKALKKQLMAAIAMVLVATIALGSSTYAWFANNNKVTAQGMSVQAAAQGGIEIKYNSSTGSVSGTATTSYATTATASLANTSLYPTSTTGKLTSGAISDWYYAVAKVRDNSEAKDDTYVTLGTETNKYTFSQGKLTYDSTYRDTKAAPEGTYYLATTFDIASVNDSQQATNLMVDKVTVTATGDTTSSLDKSLRVAVVCGTNTVIYAPVDYSADQSYKVATATTGTPATAGTATMPQDNNVTALFGTKQSTPIANTVGTEASPTQVVVYIYYEGEDTNHKTTNLAATIDQLAVSLDFVATVD